MVAQSSTGANERRRMSTLEQALLSFFWLATNVHWTAILLVTMPSQIKSAVGNDLKGSALGLALGSARSSRWWRPRPWVHFPTASVCRAAGASPG